MPEQLSRQSLPLVEQGQFSTMTQRQLESLPSGLGSPPLTESFPQEKRTISPRSIYTTVRLQAPPEPDFRAKISGPVRNLLAIFERWNVSDIDGATFLGKETPKFIEDLRAGTASLQDRDTRDRARLLLNIFEGVHSLMRTREAEISWLNSALPALQNASILDKLRNGAMIDLIVVKAFVNRANGR